MKDPRRGEVEQPGEGAGSARPMYEPPRVTPMSEDEVLAAFQVTQAGITWWVM